MVQSARGFFKKHNFISYVVLRIQPIKRDIFIGFVESEDCFFVRLRNKEQGKLPCPRIESEYLVQDRIATGKIGNLNRFIAIFFNEAAGSR